jgi:hypothetical protein
MRVTAGVTPEKEWQRPFIQRLAQTGNVSVACKRAKISRKTAYETRESDKLFDAAWKEALEVATEALELEARRRAEEGTLEPIYHQGLQVGTVRKYSDTLMIFLLKAHAPDKYRENIKNDHAGEILLRIQYGNDGTDDSAS